MVLINFIKKHYLLLFLVLAAALLRFYQLGSESFWHDELHTAIRARESIVDITNRIFSEMSGNDVLKYGVTPLGIYIIHFMYYLGGSEFILLLPVAIFGVASVILVYKLGTLLFNKSVGIVASLLITISSFHIYYSQELRSYSFQVFFSTLAYVAAIFLSKKLSLKNILLFFIANLLNYFTLASAIFVFGGSVFYIVTMYILRFRKKITYKIFNLKTIFVGVFISASLVALLTLILSSSLYVSLVKIAKLWSNPGEPILGLEFSFEYLVRMFSIVASSEVLGILIYAFFFLFGVISFKRKKISSIFFCLLFIVSPFLYLYLFGITHHFQMRHVIFSIPLFYILVASGFVKVFGQILGEGFDLKIKEIHALVFAAVIFVPFAKTEISYFYENRVFRQYSPKLKKAEKAGDWDDFRGVSRYLEENSTKDDLIIVDRDMNKSGIYYYYKGPSHFVDYLFDKKPLYTEKLGAKGRGWFICHKCPIRQITSQESAALDFEEVAVYRRSFYIYRITSKDNLVFVADVEQVYENNGWDVIPHKHNIHDNYVRVDGYFPGTGHNLELYKIVSDVPGVSISYKVVIPKRSNYNLYVNIDEWSDMRMIGVQIDDDEVLNDWEKLSKRENNKTVDIRLSTNELTSGEHIIKFTNSGNHTKQGINYFLLVSEKEVL